MRVTRLTERGNAWILRRPKRLGRAEHLLDHLIKILESKRFGEKTGKPDLLESFQISFTVLAACGNDDGFRINPANGFEDFDSIQAAPQIQIEEHGIIAAPGMEAVPVGLEPFFAGGSGNDFKSIDFPNLEQCAANPVLIVDNQHGGRAVLTGRRCQRGDRDRGRCNSRRLHDFRSRGFKK